MKNPATTRWMLLADVPTCAAMSGLSEDLMLAWFHDQDVILMVVEDKQDKILGFVSVKQAVGRYEILWIQTCPSKIRKSVASIVIDRMKDKCKISTKGRSKLTASVRSTNEPAMQFFRHHGFKAGGYERATDCFVMTWSKQ